MHQLRNMLTCITKLINLELHIVSLILLCLINHNGLNTPMDFSCIVGLKQKGIKAMVKRQKEKGTQVPYL
jgi:hypothetical protein